MKIEFTNQAKKDYDCLPEILKIKTRKKLHFLIENYRHPSLRARKMRGEDKFEARIDYHYRFTFIVKESIIYLLSIGPHNHGLGKR